MTQAESRGATDLILRAGTLIGLLVLVSCTDDDRVEVETPGFSPATLPGTWSGQFPCGNCPGIDTTLWIRPDGRFFLEQRYRADDVSSDERSVAYALGRWTWRENGRTLLLDGEGPQREFTRPDADTLFMHTASPMEHRLDRSGSDFNFDGTILQRGIVHAKDDGYLVEECLTGYEAPVEKLGDYRRFAEQFRSLVPRGGSAPLEFEGRFNWAGEGRPASITIDRFIRLLSSGGCF